MKRINFIFQSLRWPGCTRQGESGPETGPVSTNVTLTAAQQQKVQVLTVASSLRQRFLVLLMTALLIGTGSWSLNRLPVDAYPDLSPPRVEIITQWPGQAAEEVERLITVPIEVEMNGIPNMTVVRSISSSGLIYRYVLQSPDRTPMELKTINDWARVLIPCQ